MIEVAITAFNKVLEMDSDQSIKEVDFVTPLKRKDLLEKTVKTLQDNGIYESSESEWIISLTLNIKRSEVNSEDWVSASMVEKVNSIVQKRITGMPLWYCVGDVDFYGYNLKVDQRALIPRVETELIIDQAKKVVNSNSVVLDMCTGSGAIAISVKKETNAIVTAIDVSKDALDIAKENAKINNADIEFIESNLFNGIIGRKFDIIVSNPPYIKSEDILTLQKEVKDFEPNLALDGGADGLDFYRIICSNAKNYLNDNGILLLECGYNQAQEIKNLLVDAKSVEIIKDYENIDRIVKAVF
jgi:release factor glutamine methyltransferase